MELRKPYYYDAFRCLAGACPDSCCQLWEVDVDPESAEKYLALPGALGDRLRSVLRREEGQIYMTIGSNGRCPMWAEDGLCDIQRTLGEEGLCHVCTTYPRLTHDYGTFREYGLELSCPEAARLILSARPAPMEVFQDDTPEPLDEDVFYTEEDLKILEKAREMALSLLTDQGDTVWQALAMVLTFGQIIQQALDGEQITIPSPEGLLEMARKMRGTPDPEGLIAIYKSLERLTPQWEALLNHPRPEGNGMDAQYRALARYFVERYWLQTVSDFDLVSRVRFLVSACLLLRRLGGDLTSTAQLFSKEVENSAENMDTLLEAAAEDPAFATEALIELCLRS